MAAPEMTDATVGGIIVDIPQRELNVVRNAQEWRTLVRTHDFHAPPDMEFNIFTENLQFVLRPLEKVSIPFRFRLKTSISSFPKIGLCGFCYCENVPLERQMKCT